MRLSHGLPVELLLRRASRRSRRGPGPRTSSRWAATVLRYESYCDGPVLAPHLRVHGVLGHLDEAHEGLPGLLLALEDVREERQEEHGEAGDAGPGAASRPPSDATGLPRVLASDGLCSDCDMCPPLRVRPAQPPAPWPAPAWQCMQSSLPARPGAATAPSCTKSRVAAHAVVLDDAAVARRDLDRLLEVLRA